MIVFMYVCVYRLPEAQWFAGRYVVSFTILRCTGLVTAPLRPHAGNAVQTRAKLL